MIRDIKFNEDAQDSIFKGIKKTVDAVSVTLGPKGNYVIIKDFNNSPKVTKDGVSIVKEVELSDPFENVGASLIKEVAEKTLNSVGDATTTSSILTYAIIKNGIEAFKTGRYNAVKLVEGIKAAVETAQKGISSRSTEIKDTDISSIATISANNDLEIGNLIADAFKQIGRNGVITIEESQNFETSVKIIKGLHFDKGYISPHFVTNREKEVCILENPYILITEHKILRIKDIKNILEFAISNGRPILLIAEDYDDEVIETLKFNFLQGTIKICAIKTPSFGQYRKEILEDIAISTKGNNISYESGLELNQATPDDLGTCSKVIVDKHSTTILGTEGDVSERIEQINTQLKSTLEAPEMDGSFLIDFYKNRIAMLTGGIATIYVGGKTEMELQERKDRIDDAVCATKAAIAEGILPGGGIVYYNISKELDPTIYEDASVRRGVSIVKDALQEPIKILISNAGYNYENILPNITDEIGFDANTEQYLNLKEHGIIDPTKAVKLALENSASVACLFLSTKCVMVPKVANNVLM